MFSKFLNLGSEKQERIINAAMKEFALKGFENASTNEIVKAAEISKGILFHYFKNKKSLFLFLFDYCVELTLKEFFEKADFNEKDIFNKLRQATLIKLELMERYPEIFKFLEVAYLEEAREVKIDVDDKMRSLSIAAYRKFYENIDISKFKEGVDVKLAINTINWTIERFAKEALEKAKKNSKQIEYAEIIKEGDDYIELFKNCFYK
jgi:TetR/AcrR family transcriptional regulator